MKQALQKALDAKGYETLTPVQQAVTDPKLTGKDMLVSAQTGSGKTLGFGLAIAPGLFGEAEEFGTAGAPLALVIAPTRELAMQVKRELSWLFGEAGAVLASTVGGMDMRDERRALARGAHIVVATPGRLKDHIMRGSIDLSGLKAIVLDEADEMLDLGFREDLEFILEESPSDRQTLLFSATVPGAIAKLAQNYQRDAVRIATATGEKQHSDIEYRALTVSARDSENAIINVLRYYEAPNAIVFCNTRATVNRMTTRLSNRGFSVVALSGELTQSERTNALQAMRDGRARVCVATDVAARGIDLPNLELVIHAELPSNQDTLLHRSGRTGRAGRKGVSALIVPPAARKKAQRLLGWAKLTAVWAEAPSAEEVTAKDDERMMQASDWEAEVEASNREAVDRLVEMYSAEQLAAAFVRMYRERRSAPEELSDASAAPEPKKAFGPSVWFSLAGGQAVGAEPRRLLPMLCKMGNLSREDVGAIRIHHEASFIELRESAVDGFLSAIGPKMEMEDGAALTRLDAAPEAVRAARPPRGDKPQDRKPRTNKSNDRRSNRAAPDGEGAAPKAEHKAPNAGTTKPVDWNDAPEPRQKKPKKSPAGGRPPRHGEKGNPDLPQAEPWKARKPRHKASGDGFERPARPGGKASNPSAKLGPATTGKPNSKKNKARRAASEAEGGKASFKPRKPRAPKGKK
ncbi:DEAD/DEAH box helicase [Gymnodinialimonas ceratoperidinii]|uniref:DEAD/DEAH box helicase n=1 Tax=Gymnodinialimonas ceratoperidinii TaxID=2856823 RepID=A0A8F6TUJ3_9RHOB|nr:DEAD/DEAH box helicase [Gymnodinialimonas ceratoperidinii]QXT38940.1 DEAD/DEAH box helicase [Gymnodinialimonas ceratoperidinii]